MSMVKSILWFIKIENYLSHWGRINEYEEKEEGTASLSH